MPLRISESINDGWSVEDTEAFFKNYGITDKDAVGEIYKLILGSPANYLKYYIGYVEFLELKKMWVERERKRFLTKGISFGCAENRTCAV